MSLEERKSRGTAQLDGGQIVDFSWVDGLCEQDTAPEENETGKRERRSKSTGNVAKNQH